MFKSGLSENLVSDVMDIVDRLRNGWRFNDKCCFGYTDKYANVEYYFVILNNRKSFRIFYGDSAECNYGKFDLGFTESDIIYITKVYISDGDDSYKIDDTLIGTTICNDIDDVLDFIGDKFVEFDFV